MYVCWLGIRDSSAGYISTNHRSKHFWHKIQLLQAKQTFRTHDSSIAKNNNTIMWEVNTQGS